MFRGDNYIMEDKELSPEKIRDNMALDYLAKILVQAYLDSKTKNDQNFRAPRISLPIYDLIKVSKEREKLRKRNKMLDKSIS